MIAQVTTQHAGRYTVVVRDRRSSAQHTLTLSVIGKTRHICLLTGLLQEMCRTLNNCFTIIPTETPQPPASCPVISRVSATSLALSWSGPCYDGGSAILGYVVEIKNPGLAESADWRKLTDQCTSTSFVVSGLQAHQEYCFRVSAYNEVGISQPGPVSPLVRMEQKGEMIRTMTIGQRTNSLWRGFFHSYCVFIYRCKQTTGRGGPSKLHLCHHCLHSQSQRWLYCAGKTGNVSTVRNILFYKSVNGQ